MCCYWTRQHGLGAWYAINSISLSLFSPFRGIVFIKVPWTQVHTKDQLLPLSLLPSCPSQGMIVPGMTLLLSDLGSLVFCRLGKQKRKLLEWCLRISRLWAADSWVCILQLKFAYWWGLSPPLFLAWVWLNEVCRRVCAQSLQSCLTLRDPMDHSPPGSSAHGILQARTLECHSLHLSH